MPEERWYGTEADKRWDGKHRLSSSHRRRLLAAAGACLLVVSLVAILVHLGWSSLQHFDRDFGTPAEVWSLQHLGAVRFLLAIEVMFGTLGTVLYVCVLLIVLWLRGHRRAIVWSVVVMVGTSATTTVMKVSFRRQRPQWEDSVHTLTSFSFPSGHASGIASGMGVVMVLAMLYVHRSAVRRVVLTAGFTLVVIVGADRILLGVHNLSDVIAGYAVAGFWIFFALALYPPEMSYRIAKSSTDCTAKGGGRGWSGGRLEDGRIAERDAVPPGCLWTAR